MSDSRDGKAGGSDEPATPALPPHLDPRGAGRRAVPARPAPRQHVPAPPRTVLPGRPAPRRDVPEPPRPRQDRPAGARRVVRVLSWLAVATSFAIVATGAGGYLLLQRYDGNINRLPGLALGGNRPADLPRDAQNILIVGSDSRGDLAAGQGTQGKGDSFVAGQRSDTVILAHLYGDTDKAQLISFPRDAWVTIPAHTDAKTGEPVKARESKLNSAFFEGGPALLIDTIEGITGLFVDHYVQVDFDGFQTIVERLDGVEVCLSAPAKEKDSGIDLQAGRQTIKGDQALAFVRQRKGLPNGDIDRIARQQQFIGGIVRKVLSPGTLANPRRLDGVISAATGALKVDEGLSSTALSQLALRLKGFDSGGVIFTTVPIADQNARRQRQAVVLLDQAKGAELYAGIRRDVPPQTPEAAPTAAPTPGAAAQPLVIRPGAVRVRVLNGAGVPGLGRKAFGDLERVGFQLVGAAGNRGTGQTATTVFHGPDKADSARTLAASVPGAVVQLAPALGSTLELVVGSDYTGTTQVTVAGQPPAPRTPTASASASASPKVKTAAEDPCAR